MERFDEEVRLLKAESSRIPKTFDFMANEWMTRAGKDNALDSTQMERGWRAVCLRRAATFKRLASIATKIHDQLCTIEV